MYYYFLYRPALQEGKIELSSIFLPSKTNEMTWVQMLAARFVFILTSKSSLNLKCCEGIMKMANKLLSQIENDFSRVPPLARALHM